MGMRTPKILGEPLSTPPLWGPSSGHPHVGTGARTHSDFTGGGMECVQRRAQVTGGSRRLEAAGHQAPLVS